MQHKKKRFFFGFFKKFGIFWEIIQLSVFNTFFIKHDKCTAEKIEKLLHLLILTRLLVSRRSPECSKCSTAFNVVETVFENINWKNDFFQKLPIRFAK